MIKELKTFCNRIDKASRRGTGLLLAVCFFTGLAALALHHHDISFQLKSCAICKAKTSLSGTLNKVKADFPAATATVQHCPAGFDLTDSRIATNQPKPFIASLSPNPFLNKAPPVIS
ncbi:MAG: hypothetical protein M0009_01310 [Deltaproteobacteria bacterium]|nr:hypothetical protein [Deltaproteobacteria bacterium]